MEKILSTTRRHYRPLASGNTTAVFQLESRGMRDLIKRARPDRFEDVIALVALYRPGPMDLIPEYIERKHGRQRVEYLDPRLQPILGPTYGIMVYQEQVMQIAQVIGGYTLGSADLLRRAMGKKLPEEMAKHRDIFVVGAEKNGLSRAKATLLFDLMEKFAGYGFNRAHAAAYALIAYQTLLKAHHAPAFAAATLGGDGRIDKVRQFHARRRQRPARRPTSMPRVPLRAGLCAQAASAFWRGRAPASRGRALLGRPQEPGGRIC